MKVPPQQFVRWSPGQVNGISSWNPITLHRTKKSHQTGKGNSSTQKYLWEGICYSREGIFLRGTAAIFKMIRTYGETYLIHGSILYWKQWNAGLFLQQTFLAIIGFPGKIKQLPVVFSFHCYISDPSSLSTWIVCLEGITKLHHHYFHIAGWKFTCFQQYIHNHMGFSSQLCDISGW